MKPFKSLLIAFIFSLILILPVQADIAPPSQPPGASLFPETEGTAVRMLSETVLIDVQAQAPSSSLGRARVTASFNMRNLGSQSESIGVLFPLSANDGFYNYPEIGDFSVKVDGKTAATRRTTLPWEEDSLPWAQFDVIFPPGQDVLIEVSYTLEGTGEYPFISFAYLLETGAGWQDTIGSAELIVRLPYDANHQNVFIDSSPGWGFTSPGAVLSGRDVRWTYTDLEPTSANNLSVALVMPSAWNRLLTEQANVRKSPQDGEAWGRLGKIAKEISRLRRGTRDDAGGPQLFEISRDAYQKAVDLLPEDALWHAGYAELLFDHYYYTELWHSEKPGLLKALDELSIAYQLKPNDPFIQDLLMEVRSSLPEAIHVEDENATFLWLTATPTFLPSPILTITPTHTAVPPTATIPTIASATSEPTAPPTDWETAAPTSVATLTETSESGGSAFPLCSGSILPAIMLLLWVVRRR